MPSFTNKPKHKEVGAGDKDQSTSLLLFWVRLQHELFWKGVWSPVCITSLVTATGALLRVAVTSVAKCKITGDRMGVHLLGTWSPTITQLTNSVIFQANV